MRRAPGRAPGRGRPPVALLPVGELQRYVAPRRGLTGGASFEQRLAECPFFRACTGELKFAQKAVLKALTPEPSRFASLKRIEADARAPRRRRLPSSTFSTCSSRARRSSSVDSGFIEVTASGSTSRARRRTRDEEVHVDTGDFHVLPVFPACCSACSA